MSAPSQGLNFRIAPPPVSSPFSSAAPSPSPSSNPSSPRSDSSSSNPLPPPSLSRSSSAFKIPHAPVRPSPLAAAQRGSGFVPYVGDESDSDDEGANKRMTAHASHNHGDDEEEVGWDLDGSGRGTYSRKASPPPLTIAPLANKDWRNSSRSSKTHVASTSSNPNRASSSRQMYLPSGAQHPSNASSTEPVVTREVSSTDATGGLILATSRITAPAEGSVGQDAKNEVDEANVQVEVTPLTLEERAMKALLGGDDGDDEERELEAIPTAGNNRQMMISEEEAFRRDVETRPEESTINDYKRIPVASFGLAIMKGMGWKEGSAASRTRKGLVQPYNPTPRPAMLGIGAKERIVPEGEQLKGKQKWKAKEEARKYMPVMRKETGSSTSTPSSSVPPSRRNSRSRSPPPLRDDRRSDRRRQEKERDRPSSKWGRERSPSRERHRDSYRDKDDDRRRRERSRSRERDSSRRDRGGRDDDRSSRSRRDDGEDRDRRREKDRDYGSRR